MTIPSNLEKLIYYTIADALLRFRNFYQWRKHPGEVGEGAHGKKTWVFTDMEDLIYQKDDFKFSISTIYIQEKTIIKQRN